jgi:hypothetical protein
MLEPVLPAYSDVVIAIAAVNRLIAARLKRDFCLLATLGTGCGIHLSRASVVATAAISRTLGSFCRATRRAALWFIGEAFGSEELLLFSCEGECLSAIGTREGFFCVSH